MCKTAIAVGNGCADGWWVVAFDIFESAADAKFAVLIAAADGTEPALVFAFAFIMAGYNAFGIVLAFEF